MNDNIDNIFSKIYNLLAYTNKNNFIIDNIEESYQHFGNIDRRNIELIQSPDITEKECRGSCYDQSFLVKKWFDEAEIENKIFYSVTDNLNKENDIFYYTGCVTSHTFILCFVENKWKWIEWSWHANIHNKFENEDINEVLKSYKNTAESSWHHPIKLFDISNIDFILPYPRLKFLNDCLNKGILL